jgi:hypothetical protein
MAPTKMVRALITPKALEINKILEDVGSDRNVEIETRFYWVSDQAYHRIYQQLQKDSISMVESKTKDVIIKGVRYSTLEGSEVSVISKDTKERFNDDNFDIVTVVSVKKTSQEKEIPLETPELIRDKERTRFIMSSTPNVVINLTYTVETVSTHQRTPRFEVEAEILHLTAESLGSRLEELEIAVNYLLRLIQGDTSVIYTKKETDSVIASFNRILKASYESSMIAGKRTVLSHTVMSEARNLKLSDCVDGGIVGGEYKYSLTLKARGERKFLMFHNTGVWLIYPPHDFILVFRMSNVPDIRTKRILEQLDGTIIDGEIIQVENRVTTGVSSGYDVKYLYVPFDCMAVQNKIDVQKEDLGTRQEIAMKVCTPISRNDRIRIIQKKFIPLTYDNFFTATQELHANSSVFKTDGYMVTPINSPYLTVHDPKTLFRRNLDSDPEICKIKPWTQLTIDLRYTIKEGKPRLEVNRKIGDGSRYEIKPTDFSGSFFFPFDQDTDWDYETISVRSGTIIEMEPYRRENGKIALRQLLVRYNKNQPNREEIASDIWDDINKPFNLDVFEGKAFNLLFQYHNLEKLKLIKTIPEGSDIIDIGAGRGSDFNKYSKFHHLLAVDPSKENLEEYQRRIDFHPRPEIKTEVTLLHAGGEETDRIVSTAGNVFGWANKTKRPLAIVMMLSLSFFYGPDQKYKQLYHTLRKLERNAIAAGAPSVDFYFMTISGKEVNDLMENRPNEKVLGPCKLTFDGMQTLNIDIPGTTMENRTEYLVPLKHLQDEFINVETMRTCTHQKLLTPEEQIFTRLFVIGKGKIKTSSKKTDPVVVINKDSQFEYLKYSSSDSVNGMWNSIARSLGLGKGVELRVKYLEWLATPNPSKPETTIYDHFITETTELDKRFGKEGGAKEYLYSLPPTSPVPYQYLFGIPYFLSHKIIILSSPDMKQIAEFSSPDAKGSIGLIVEGDFKFWLYGKRALGSSAITYIF